MSRLRFAALALCAVTSSSIASRAASATVPPQRIDDIVAPYPAGAEGDGTVVLTAVIDAQGAVREVTAEGGTTPFTAAAVEAVKTWRFLPARRDETPVASRIKVTVTFHAPVPAKVGRPPPPEEPAVGPSPAAKGGPQQPVEVAVRGEREELGTNHIARTESRFIPGAFGDPFRAIEALPGMTPWLSGLPYYYVRGAPPESVGYYIDGIRVPLLFHVGAGPSTMAPALVDSVDLFPGAYPAATDVTPALWWRARRRPHRRTIRGRSSACASSTPTPLARPRTTMAAGAPPSEGATDTRGC